jgi:GNAT superfamily N-acetyltransferase
VSAARLRDWTPADDPALEDLWRRVFPAPRGGQTLAWLFRPGPAGSAVRVVAELDGAIVAHAGVVPLRFLVGGERVRGGYSVGAMTDPARQRRGLYVELGRYLYDRLQREGFAFVAGFSNRRSHRVMTGPLGRTQIQPFPWCVRPVLPGFAALRTQDPVETSQAAIPARHGAIDVDVTAPDDARLDGLWARVAPTIRVGAVRDAAFAAWRYGTRPDAGYVCAIAAGAEGTAIGALLLRVLPIRGFRVGFVLDLLVDPEAPAAGRALLRAAARATRAAGGCALSALLPAPGPTRQALRRAGFVRVPEALHPQVIRFSVRGLERFAGHPALGDARDWWLSWSDTDVV